MDVNWTGLGLVLVVGLAVGVGLCVLLATAVRLLAGPAVPTAPQPYRRALAYLCLAAYAGAILSGIWLIFTRP